MLGAALTVHPAAFAIKIVLALPDRQTHFDLINDVAGGLKGLVTMRLGHADNNCHIAQLKHAFTVNTGRPVKGPPLSRLVHNALTFAAR